MISGKIQEITEGSGGAVTPRSVVKHWEVFDMADDTANPLNVPYGYCHCGCGQKTPISTRKQTFGAPHRYINGHWKKGRTQDERFWSKVQKSDGCWRWTGATHHFGYGRFSEGERPHRRHVQAHRLSWEMAYGSVPEGLHVLHKCDNPACVRPDHLFVGTPLDNMQDMDRKGRRRWTPMPGERNPKAKLTAEQVREIRNTPIVVGDLEHGYKAVGKRYGVTPQQIKTIVCGDQWKGAEYWPDAELTGINGEAAEMPQDERNGSDAGSEPCTDDAAHSGAEEAA